MSFSLKYDRRILILHIRLNSLVIFNIEWRKLSYSVIAIGIISNETSVEWTEYDIAGASPK